LRVNRSVTVKAPADRAFRAFTEEIGTWWPLAEGFAFAGDRYKDMFLEGREAGRVYELSRDGREFPIGTVTAYDPPTRIVFTWGEATEEWDTHTEVEVRFTEEHGATRVDLEHRGFERIGPAAEETQGTYTRGWVAVLDRYRLHAAA
jgi:uncharacterized protein YndB with AHSA1/START domain